jgi:hypothetical protein
MVRIRNLLWMSVLLVAASTAFAGGLPDQRGAATVSGVYSVTFNLRLASELPAGSMITCRARLVPNQGGNDLRNLQLPATPVAAGQALVTGSTVTCAAEIPFAWTITSAPDGVVMSYEIQAVSSRGAMPVLLRSSALRLVGTAFPASCGSSGLSLTLIF